MIALIFACGYKYHSGLLRPYDATNTSAGVGGWEWGRLEVGSGASEHNMLYFDTNQAGQPTRAAPPEW